jgi:hypothetical protein
MTAAVRCGASSPRPGEWQSSGSPPALLLLLLLQLQLLELQELQLQLQLLQPAAPWQWLWQTLATTASGCCCWRLGACR